MISKLQNKQRVVLLLIILVSASVNLTKAVHIDDTAYLEIAQAIIRHPLHPLSQEINWENTAQPIFNINQPLLVPYIYAILIKIFGESEFVLHLFIAVCSGLSIYLFFILALFFQIRYSLFLTWMFALGPAFLPGQNLMVDIPLMVSWLFFFWMLFSVEEDNKKKYIFAGIAAAISCMIKYTSLTLLPVMLLIIIFRRHWRSLWYLGIPLVTLALWSIFNYYDYGAIHILGRTTRPLTLQILIYRMISWIAGVGAVSPFVLSFIDIKKSDPANKLLMLVGGALGVILSVYMVLSNQDQFLIYWFLFFVGGVLVNGFIILHLVQDIQSGLQEKKRMVVDKNILLGLWVVGTFGFIIMFSPFLAVRHILLVVPVVLLILGTHLSATEFIIPRETVSMGLTIFLGVSLAISDYFYADIYRYNAYKIRHDLPQTPHVYQVGHWGWQWYSIKAGMIQYDKGMTHLRNNDLLVVALNISSQQIEPDYLPNLQILQRINIPAPAQTWIRTMYDRGYYYFRFPTSPPWFFSKAPFEFEVYEYIE